MTRFCTTKQRKMKSPAALKPKIIARLIQEKLVDDGIARPPRDVIKEYHADETPYRVPADRA
jgi:hypothetical protein